MTNKEAIELLKDHEYWTDFSWMDEVAEMAIEALEKADKYRWHNLRKTPNDLPPCEEEVEITYERIDGKYGSARAIYEDGTMHSEKSIFFFDELDALGELGEYCEETDDYIILPGWFEAVKFAESMGSIDEPIIAWKKIKPFEVEG